MSSGSIESASMTSPVRNSAAEMPSRDSSISKSGRRSTMPSSACMTCGSIAKRWAKMVRSASAQGACTRAP